MRKGKGLTQEQVAGRLEWSPSKLIRIEGGRSSITKVDLEALMSEYGVTSESQRERILAYNRTAREKAWWDDYRRGSIDSTYLNYVGYEAGAAFIRQFPGTVVPGLLQTPEYAEVLTERSVAGVQVAPVVRLRMQRQSELAERESPPRQYYVLDEAVIRRHIGIRKDPAIMPNQLRHIADKAESDGLVTVRVIPFSVGAHAGLAGPFTLLEFNGDLPDILYLDAGRSAIAMIVGDDQQVAEYKDNFESLLDDALDADKSVAFIRSVAGEML
jgi:transcriptional regulator with XRE-family HTH domain